MISKLFLLASVAVIVAAHHERHYKGSKQGGGCPTSTLCKLTTTGPGLPETNVLTTDLGSTQNILSLPLKAVALLTDPRGSDIKGNVTFTELPDGKVHVQASLYGLPPGHYGFHVHEKGDITGGCLSTGSHYNPEHKDHGHPLDDNRHVGDLGNVEFDENKWSHLDVADSLLALQGPHCIIGRAVVLHEKGDDFGRSDHPDSKKTGNAGGRVACGVIGILSSDSYCGHNSATGNSVSIYWLSLITLTMLISNVNY